ncbi:hypothetical protein B0H14DRAFT_2614395 [Mycena olivaceomarginata]|nr:hypothetical protein B0H14DRAFT_2614395 [Mycena olivaceomarginata]
MNATLLYTAILRHKDSDAIPSLKLPFSNPPLDRRWWGSSRDYHQIGLLRGKTTLQLLGSRRSKPSCLTTRSRFTARSTQFPGRRVARMWTAPCTEPQYPPAALDPTTFPAYMSTFERQITRKDYYPVLMQQHHRYHPSSSYAAVLHALPNNRTLKAPAHGRPQDCLWEPNT